MEIVGEIDVPSGTLAVLDPGLARASLRRHGRRTVDLEIVGPDAELAGRRWDRSYDPLALYDKEDASSWIERFAELAKAEGLDARAVLREQPFSIQERVERALRARAAGIGVLELPCWAVVAGGLPRDRPLTIAAAPMPEGEFRGRLRSINVRVHGDRSVARSQRVEGVAVEHGAVLLLDASLLGELQVEPADGLADLVLWGPDAAELARDLGASDLGANGFGWRDLPLAEVGTHARPLYDAIESRSLRVSTDYRPHDDIERLWAQIRTSPARSGSITVAGRRALALDTRWGDGLVPVIRDLDEQGEVVSIRVDVGNEETQDLMRRVLLRHRGALVSRRVLAGAQPARYADRHAATRDTDSGWVVSSGAETGMTPEEFAVVRVDELLRSIEALADVIDTPAPARFTLRGDTYRRDA